MRQTLRQKRGTPARPRTQPRPRYAGSRLRGRPPFAPLALAAAAFAFDRRRPPRCPVARANKRVPNARSTSPGTYTSTSSDGQDTASPAGETLIDPSAEVGTSSRPGTICRGIVIDPPPRNLRSIASRLASVLCIKDGGRILHTRLPSCSRASKAFTVFSGHLSGGHGASPIPGSRTVHSVRPVVPHVSHPDRRSRRLSLSRDGSTSRSSRLRQLSRHAHAPADDRGCRSGPRTLPRGSAWALIQIIPKALG